jgi:hypothetical protein
MAMQPPVLQPTGLRRGPCGTDRAGTWSVPPAGTALESARSPSTPDGRWGLVGGRDPALGTRTAQAWKFITGKPVTPPLGAYGMAHSIVVSPDGARALASMDNKTFLQWLDLADLSAPDEMDVDDLCTFAELTAGQRVYEGGLAGLTSDEWLSRLRTFRKRHAQLEKAVEVLKGEIKRNGRWLMPPGGRRT